MTDSYQQENINLAGDSSVVSATSSFVYQPGAPTTAPDNVFSDWNELMVVLNATEGDRAVVIDDSIVSPAVIPAGTYDMSGVTLEGNFSFPGTLLDLAPGVTFTNLQYLRRALIMNQTGPVPAITLNTGDVRHSPRCNRGRPSD